MRNLVIYKSETGFTKQYAQWIAAALECEAVDLKNVTNEMLQASDRVIFGGSLMANGITGYSKISKMPIKELIIFAVGFSKDTAEIRAQVKNQNHLGDVPLFYMQGGIKYEKMNFITKAMLKKITGEKTSVDYSDKKNINELIKYINSKGPTTYNLV